MHPLIVVGSQIFSAYIHLHLFETCLVDLRIFHSPPPQAFGQEVEKQKLLPKKALVAKHAEANNKLSACERKTHAFWGEATRRRDL